MTLFSRWGGLLLAAAFIAPLAIACGGGDDTGSDEDYVKAFCEAKRAFSEALPAAIKAVNDSGGKDPGRIARPYEDLADAFDDMDPPEDLKDWHDNATDRLKDRAKAIKDGQAGDASDPVSGIPDGPRARLRQQAEKEPACNQLNVFES